MISDVVQSFVQAVEYQPKPETFENDYLSMLPTNLECRGSIYRYEFAERFECPEQMLFGWFFAEELKQCHCQFDCDIIENLKYSKTKIPNWI